jgi:alkanesulfonate monooxygenase SsuD/methylene tetrahydromethanopterin reductase-like flavin-dependent oxidoreductase (luciferase family)
MFGIPPQAINLNAPTVVNLFQFDGVTPLLFGAPTAVQNKFSSKGRISSVQVVPVANQPATQLNRTVLVARLVLAGEIATVDHLSNGRVNVGLGSGWMPEEFAAASVAHLFPKRHKHVRETIEVLQGIWTNEVFEYHGEFADFEPCGFGAKPIQRPHPPIYFSGLKDPKRSARRIAKYGLAGWIGIQDTPEEIVRWRAEIQHELVEMGSSRSLDDGFDMCSMIWFTITDAPTDQTNNGKLSNLLVGTAEQITDNLKRYRDAGMDMPLLWPPFTGVPVSKTLDDLKRLAEEIMPKVNAG